MTVGETIRQRRKALGMTQGELAERIGTIKQTIYKYERGVIRKIPMEKLLLLGEALGLDPKGLFGEDEKRSIERLLGKDGEKEE